MHFGGAHVLYFFEANPHAVHISAVLLTSGTFTHFVSLRSSFPLVDYGFNVAPSPLYSSGIMASDSECERHWM